MPYFLRGEKMAEAVQEENAKRGKSWSCKGRKVTFRVREKRGNWKKGEGGG
jgi:hypothetical protein